jgi:hypothetical protein
MWDRACEMSILPFPSLQSGPHLSTFSMFYYFLCPHFLLTGHAGHLRGHHRQPIGLRPVHVHAPSAGLLGTQPTQTSVSPLSERRHPPVHALPLELSGQSSLDSTPEKACARARPWLSSLLAIVEPCPHGKRGEEFHPSRRPVGPCHSSAEGAKELHHPVGRPRPPLDACPSPSLPPLSRGQI